MSEITSLVTAEAVKEVLRSEEVLSALKQKLRHNLEARLDAEVDAILDELLGVYRQSHRLKREIPPQRAVKFSLNHRSPMRLNLNPNRS